MPGWSNEALFCTVPICDPGCNGNGNCTAPNTCECWIGWAGPECNQCICLPGCVNGGCQHPFECTCDDGYEGMFCDKRKLDSIFVKNRGFLQFRINCTICLNYL